MSAHLTDTNKHVSTYQLRGPRGKLQEQRTVNNLVQRITKTNSIGLNVAEQGEGQLVLLCHGFPEGWYSWRHQIEALAKAGFHAAAPDMRR